MTAPYGAQFLKYASQGVHKKFGLQNTDNPDIILTFLAKNPDIFFLYRPRVNILAETSYLFPLRSRQVS